MAYNDTKSIGSSLESHANYFSTKLELIPSQFYFDKEEKDEDFHTKFMRNKRRKDMGLGMSEEQKKAIKQARVKKFDPRQYKSVPAILHEKAMEEESDEEEESQEEGEKSGEKEAAIEIVPGFVNIAEREELRRRLREKINALRAKRKAPPLNEDGTDPLEEENGRKNKRRRLDEKEENSNKPQHQNKRLKGIKGETGGEKSEKGENGERIKEEKVKPEPTFSNNSLEFATFDFSSGQPVPQYLKNNKKKPSKHALLRQAQEKKAKLESLKGTEEGQKLASNEQWKTMIKRAQGEKIKDDPERIKKSIKREQARKNKSGKQWKQRLDTQKKKQSEVQRKRESNIEASKQKRKDRKMGKKPAAKRPGFEGKKTQFINNKSKQQ